MEKNAPQHEKLAEILAAMIGGSFETPPWHSFLERLRLATRADFSVLIVHPPGRPMDDGLRLSAGGPHAAEIASLYRNILYPVGPKRRDWIPEGRSGALEELRPTDHGTAADAFRDLVDGQQIVGSRQFRITEPNGVEAWLAIGKKGSNFGDAETHLLAALVEPLRGVLRAHVAHEKGRFAATMAAEAVRRLQCGWFLLDQDGHILASDEFGDAIFDSAGVLGRSSTGRLTVRPQKLEREILAAIEQIAAGHSTRPKAISLRADPWLDMLLVPARTQMISDTAVPAVIAYVHGDNWKFADRCAQLCDLFDLSPSEGRLALALCRGLSISEAAEELGLRLETARSYSKSIYAKTGTRGMADLVRVVMGSVLALAPDS